jgi:hypothetical protein
MKTKTKTDKYFIEGYIQGEYKERLKINEALKFIKENLHMWDEEKAFKEFIENIERILKQ